MSLTSVSPSATKNTNPEAEIVAENASPPSLRSIPADSDDDTDSDIYRGERPPSPESHTSLSSSSSSSSSSQNYVGRRLGALATVVELAITRWARGNASSSSSSDTSSVPSKTTTTRTQTRLRRRPSSTATVHNAQSEKIIRARQKARLEFRLIPREFVLLLPPSLCPCPPGTPQESGLQQRLTRTSSLPLIISHLEHSLKRSARPRIDQAYSSTNNADLPHHDYMVPVLPPELSIKGKEKKGKRKDIIGAAAEGKSSGIPGTSEHRSGPTVARPEQTWWLDVSNPTWEDLRSIGKTLHLHPLTLEDILQQDPREKLELFPKLGYYFIAFRALEGERSRQRFRRFKGEDSEPHTDFATGPGDEGVIGAVNVYLVVFKEGICSFHFEDISEHLDRMRNRVLQLEETFNMSPDWIAHGLLDSIVDSFFPVLNGVENEIEELDALVLEHAGRPLASAGLTQKQYSSPTEAVVLEVSVEKAEKHALASGTHNEKSGEPASKEHLLSSSLPRARFSLPSAVLMPSFSLRRLRHSVRRRIYGPSTGHNVDTPKSPSPTYQALVRMAATRRIVTSLSRLLATKGEVVMQMRKRLHMIGSNGGGLNISSSEIHEVDYHLSDVQDHIFTLQQSLAYYDRMLGHSQPAYLSQLRVSLSQAKAGMDGALFLLSVISVTIVCIQLTVGIFSMNVRIPKNAHQLGAPFNYFYGIIVFAVFVTLGLLWIIRMWQAQAKRKFNKQM
ncbi:hypothetical protein BD410DRAFT_893604 [Rickenella mellea]|uniref:Cora-domain-containing protein n=1 Tax=Rickenella mellea TaxID=50990 RepID=A0A4Y7QNZ1_9AGAM|nr:hypothetical protein BD410DRAFT_893604 [Rickenella mellea]